MSRILDSLPPGPWAVPWRDSQNLDGSLDSLPGGSWAGSQAISMAIHG